MKIVELGRFHQAVKKFKNVGMFGILMRSSFSCDGGLTLWEEGVCIRTQPRAGLRAPAQCSCRYWCVWVEEGGDSEKDQVGVMIDVGRCQD